MGRILGRKGSVNGGSIDVDYRGDALYPTVTSLNNTGLADTKQIMAIKRTK
jgi:hypothetical protein